MWAQIAVTAGVVSTALFVLSTLPMLLKAARTKDLSSYSGSNLVIANTGNAVQMLYVITLPPGPVWALHGFNTAASALMLTWWMRHRGRTLPQPETNTGPAPRTRQDPPSSVEAAEAPSSAT